MFRNATRMPDDDLHEPIGALFAGIALLTLLALRVIHGPAGPIQLGYWMPLLFGVVMMLHGITALVHRRNTVARRAGE